MKTELDCIIKDARVVRSGGITNSTISIKDGKITSIDAECPSDSCSKIIDAKKRFLLPGLVDAHVHFREPGYIHKETWATGSAAAAVGGVTTVLEMPNTNPPTASPERLAMKAHIASKTSIVDFGLYALFGSESIDSIDAIVDAGAIGFKCFLGNTFGDLAAPSDLEILKGFKALARRRVRCAVHAENADTIKATQNLLRNAGRTDVRAHRESRPDVCEVEAVTHIIELAEATGAQIHIAHLSSRFSLPVIADARRRGVDVTVETCPHYIFLDEDDVVRLGGLTIVNPPIRSRRDRDALWDAVSSGVIDFISSDHAPHSLDEKSNSNVWDCIGGMPGVETQALLLLGEVANGRLSLEQFVKLTATTPAQVWGLYPRKGSIEVGADADLNLVDLNGETQIDANRLHSLNPMSPWHGKTIQAGILWTMRRGQIIAENGEPVASGGGLFLKPALHGTQMQKDI